MARSLGWSRAATGALLGLGLVAGTGAAPASADSVVTTWTEAGLQAIRDTKPAPTVVARDLAVLDTCMYDAWAAYDDKAVGTRLGGSLRRPAGERTLDNKAKAISFAAYRALVDLFPQPAEVAQFNALMQQLGLDPNDNSTDTSTPTGIGNVAAHAVLTFRHADGSNQLGDLHPGAYSDYTGYTPLNDPDHINDPNRWQPLRVSDGKGGTVVQKYATPHWGRVIPFALTTGSMFRAPAPARYPSPDYSAHARQELNFSTHLTDVRKMTAEYWADGPNSELPPGHWAIIADFVSHRDHMSLDQDVKLFFLQGNAVFDAGIACWETKRAYDSVRPITAIHFLYKGKKIRAWGGPGKGTQTINGEDYQPYGQAATVVTPPFAEHTSGHSTFSAASAEVLKRFTGSDRCGFSARIPAGSSTLEPGLTPKRDIVFTFKTFTDGAKAAGMSRIYSGIHFMPANLQGQAMGRQVGVLVWNKALTYFNGTAAPPAP